MESTTYKEVPDAVIDVASYERAVQLKLNEYSKRVWAELDYNQIANFQQNQQEVEKIRHDI
jgi:hypothetical protein